MASASYRANTQYPISQQPQAFQPEQPQQQDPQYGSPQPPPQQQAPAAPQGGYNREQFRDSWMSSGGRTVQDLQNFINNNPSFASGVKLGGSKGDVATMPDGEVLDLVIAAGRGGEGAGWTGILGTGGQPLTGNVSGGGGVGGGVSGSMSASQSGVPRDAKWDELYNMLMGRAKQGLAVDQNDPNIRNQTDSFAAEQERGNRNYLRALAEKGGPGANLGTEGRMANEQANQATGNLRSQLVGHEIAARRQEIQQALTQMGGMLSEEQKMALQRELAIMDDATRRYGIGTQAELGRGSLALQGQDLSLRGEDRASYWDAVRSGLLG